MPNTISKILDIANVKSGMELGQVVVSENGKVVLSEGTILTVTLINRLREWGISNLSVKELTDPQPDGLEQGNRSDSQKTFDSIYNDTVDRLKECFQNMRYFQKIPMNEMKELADTAIESFINSIGVINQLQMVRRKDDYTFHHSINVATISGLLGKWLGYRDGELKNLILSGLLHDIGKSQIPLEILNKPGKLTESEQYKMGLHPVVGYELIKDETDVAQDVKIVILQHHERMDGTGYPSGLVGPRIHSFSRIVAIADIYDAMTSDRVYRQKVSPFAVVEMLSKEMFDKIDPLVGTTFLNNIRDYFLGNVVELDDGRQAEVVYSGGFLGARPVVHTDDDEFIDLEKNKTITIVNIIKG